MKDRMVNQKPKYMKTIEVIKTPLHFYALSLLIVESFLGIVLIFSDLNSAFKMVGMIFGVILFGAVIFIVTYIVIREPKDLTYGPKDHLKEEIIGRSKIEEFEIVDHDIVISSDKSNDIFKYRAEADDFGIGREGKDIRHGKGKTLTDNCDEFTEKGLVTKISEFDIGTASNTLESDTTVYLSLEDFSDIFIEKDTEEHTI